MVALPISYKVDRVVLMARDPIRLHAYWDISSVKAERELSAVCGGRLILRLYDNTDGSTVEQLEVSAESGSAWFALNIPGRAYMADLAAANADRIEVIARSNTVRMPSTSVRLAPDPVFVGREEQSQALRDGATLPTRSASGQYGSVSAGWQPGWLASALAPRQPAAGVNAWLLWPSWMSSEARLLSLGSELRLHKVGSEHRLLSTGLLHVPFAEIRPAMPPVVLQRAIDDVAVAIQNRSPVDIADRCRRLVDTLRTVGTPQAAALLFLPLADDALETLAAGAVSDAAEQIGGRARAFTGAPGSEVGRSGQPQATSDSGSGQEVSRSGGWSITAVATPTGLAAFAAGLSGFAAGVYGGIARWATPEVAQWVGAASDLAWSISGTFTVAAVLLTSSPIGPETPPGVISNPDGSVSLALGDGSTLTLGPVSFDSGATVPNPDGSVTFTAPDGTSVTLGPATFGGTGSQETGEGNYAGYEVGYGDAEGGYGGPEGGYEGGGYDGGYGGPEGGYEGGGYDGGEGGGEDGGGGSSEGGGGE
ncbi:DUF4912 domain-containing protein [Streptomyces mirabilis]|uniref:DUF4912 domain-containing protein n=1 Tax=Streptomyces mirabilis TaxID=68239 RepID=UPI0036A27CC9